jgi:hypothetical protein
MPGFLLDYCVGFYYLSCFHITHFYSHTDTLPVVTSIIITQEFRLSWFEQHLVFALKCNGQEVHSHTCWVSNYAISNLPETEHEIKRNLRLSENIFCPVNKMHQDSCKMPMKVSVFWNMMPCSLVYKYMHFGGVRTPNLQGNPRILLVLPCKSCIGQ